MQNINVKFKLLLDIDRNEFHDCKVKQQERKLLFESLNKNYWR